MSVRETVGLAGVDARYLDPLRIGNHVFDNNGSFLLAMFEFFIFFAWLMCLFWVFSDVFRSRDIGGVAKTFWILFIIVVPFLGMVIYLIARGHGMHDRAIESQKHMQAAQVEYAQAVVASQGGTGPSDQIASGKALSTRAQSRRLSSSRSSPKRSLETRLRAALDRSEGRRKVLGLAS